MAVSSLGKLTDFLKNNGEHSCRKLAKIFDTSKSSVHRKQQKINGRSHIAGADFFETEEGQQWLLRLVVATILVFGIIAGIGAERIAFFFSLIVISTFVSVSASSVTRMETQLDDLILKYKSHYDANVMEKASELDITPGGDETYFENLMLIVLMDLNSGFIFVEKPEKKRDHKMWKTILCPGYRGLKRSDVSSVIKLKHC